MVEFRGQKLPERLCRKDKIRALPTLISVRVRGGLPVLLHTTQDSGSSNAVRKCMIVKKDISNIVREKECDYK
jgi:hypothetical protein